MHKETKGKSKLRNENYKDSTDKKKNAHTHTQRKTHTHTHKEKRTHTHTKKNTHTHPQKGLNAISNRRTMSEMKKKSLDMLTSRMDIA